MNEVVIIVKGEGRDAEATFKAVTKAVEGMGETSSRVGRVMDFAFGSLAADAFAKTAGAALDVGKSAIKLASDMEQSRIGFTTMLGSAERADRFLRELAGFAASTPFQFSELQDASRRMLAFGFTSGQVVPMLTAVGNAVAGLGGGSEMINRVTVALGQMQAKGKVSAEEMMQLAEAGIPAWKILADAIGVDIPKAMKLAEEGAIPAAAAIDALVTGMNQKFPDMMAKQSQTLQGQLSNLQDKTEQALTRVGEKFIEAFDIKEAVAGANSAIDSIEPHVVGLIDVLGRAKVAGSQVFAILADDASRFGMMLHDITSRIRGLDPDALRAGQAAFAQPQIPDYAKDWTPEEQFATIFSAKNFANHASNEQLTAMNKYLRELGDSANKASTGFGGLSTSAAKAKSVLEQLGVSAGDVRGAMDVLEFSTDKQRSVLLALGVDALDAGEMLEGLGITTDRLAAAFNRAGLDGAALVQQIKDITAATKAQEEAEKAQRKAEREAEEAAAKAREEARKAEEAALKARQAAMHGITGVGARDLMGALRGRTPNSAGQAADDLDRGAAGLEALAKAGMDTGVALSLMETRLGNLGALLHDLGGDEGAAAGAALDGINKLLKAFHEGTIGVEEFRDGISFFSSDLDAAAAKIDAAAEKVKQFNEERGRAIAEGMMKGLSGTEAAAAFGKSEWIQSLEENLAKGGEAVGLAIAAGIDPAPMLAALQPVLDAWKDATTKTIHELNQEAWAILGQEMRENSKEMVSAWMDDLKGKTLASQLSAGVAPQGTLQRDNWERAIFGRTAKEFAQDAARAVAEANNAAINEAKRQARQLANFGMSLADVALGRGGLSEQDLNRIIGMGLRGGLSSVEVAQRLGRAGIRLPQSFGRTALAEAFASGGDTSGILGNIQRGGGMTVHVHIGPHDIVQYLSAEMMENGTVAARFGAGT